MSFSMLGCCSDPGSGTCAGAPSNAQILIVDNAEANPYPSGLYASGSNPVVKINAINHPSPDDIDMLLLAPNGVYCMLMSDCGGVTDALVNVDLTIEQGGTPFPDITAITTGTYGPADYDLTATILNVPTDNMGSLVRPFTGWLINNAAGYSAGATVIAVDSGTGVISVGVKLKFQGLITQHEVTAFDGVSITITPGLPSARGDNTPIYFGWPLKLSDLSGTGIWELYVKDDRVHECGWIVSWQLVFGSTTYGDAFNASNLCGWAEAP